MQPLSRTPRERRVLGVLLLALVPLLGGCWEARSPLRIRPGPVIQEQRTGISVAALRKVAVFPFYPAGQSVAPGPGGAHSPAETTGWQSAELIANFVAETLRARGVDAIPPSDVERVFVGEGQPVPRQDPRAAVDRAGASFGASAVVLGRVLRFREREGSAAGAARPASVAFELSVHDVPTGRRLWTGRFDETQHAISENVFRAREYPGAGSRWLTALEFARWGAERAVAAMLASS